MRSFKARGWLGGLGMVGSGLTIAFFQASGADCLPDQDAGFDAGPIAPFCTGVCVTLASGQNGPWDIAVDSTSAYWTDTASGTVMKVPLDGGTPVTLASNQDGPGDIAVDAVSVYWTNGNGGTVMKVPLGGGTPTTLVSGTDEPRRVGR